MNLTVQRWERAKELLHQAMQLDRETRARFLDEACSADAPLRAELESLLVAEERVRSSFLESPPHPDLVPDPHGAAAPVQAGQIFARALSDSCANLAKVAWGKSGWPSRLLQYSGKWP